MLIKSFVTECTNYTEIGIGPKKLNSLVLKLKSFLATIISKDKCISKAIEVISDRIYYSCTKGKSYISFDTRYGDFHLVTGCPVEYPPEVFGYFKEAWYDISLDHPKISWT